MLPNTPKGLPLRNYRGVTKEAHSAIRALANANNISQGAVISYLVLRNYNKLMGVTNAKENTN